MNKEKRFKSVPIRSKTGLTIRITRKDPNFDQETRFPVNQTKISTLRSTKTNSKIIKNDENESSMMSTRSRTTTPRETDLLKDQTLIHLRKELLETHDFSNVSTKKLNQLSVHLRLYATDCILNRDYDEAEDCDGLAIEVKEEISNRDNSLGNSVTEDHEADMHNHLDKYIAELDSFDEQTIQKREELEKKQSNEFEEFERKWREDMPKRYRKPSTKLISMIENERKVGLQGNYSLAREMKAKTDEQRRIEAENAQERLNTDFIAAREKLLDKQIKERELFDQTRAENRQLLVRKQEHELKGTINRGVVLSMKEQKQYKQKKHFPYSESKANTAQLLKKGRDNDILLPPLSPPDYKTIKQAEAEKAKMNAKKNKETEERLLMRDEPRRKFAERVARVLGLDASPTSNADNTTSQNETPNSSPNINEEKTKSSESAPLSPTVAEDKTQNSEMLISSPLKPSTLMENITKEEPKAEKKIPHVVFHEDVRKMIENSSKAQQQTQPIQPVQQRQQQIVPQKVPTIKKTIQLKPRKESPQRNSARSNGSTEDYSYYSDDEYYYSDE